MYLHIHERSRFKIAKRYTIVKFMYEINVKGFFILSAFYTSVL